MQRYTLIQNSYFWISRHIKTIKLGFMWKNVVYEFNCSITKTDLIGEKDENL